VSPPWLVPEYAGAGRHLVEGTIDERFERGLDVWIPGLASYVTDP
jgi:hypothetical protein